jgi:2-oxoglutarate ferredoxin oxidoreductase subunit delta
MGARSRVVTRQPIVARPPAIHGRVFVRVERCKGCRFCAEFCPQKVLQMSREFNAKGFHYPTVARPELCINCSLCSSICPDYAILAFPAASAGDGGPNGGHSDSNGAGTSRSK